MICFNCGVKLHDEESQECRLCGVRFVTRCPSCRHPNPLMGRYCFNCGRKIPLSHDQSSVQNYDTLFESRKKVAVIFADISGFTSLSEKMDPEEVRELINDCFNYITKPVYEFEGTIDKFIGDCVMVLFGAKYAHIDDAKRAVLCAVKMMNLLGEFSQERLQGTGHLLSMTIGIDYGLVVTGSVGNYFDKDYTVIGDIVNTAQRLQANAPRGGILVSESVYLETRDIIKYSGEQKITVKNKEKAVKCYLPVLTDSVAFADRDMPFVGRGTELEELARSYKYLSNKGSGCLMITGEQGIGKTRLLKEFSTRLDNDTKKIWVDCSSMSQNRFYYLISCILTGIMNITPEDSMNVKQHRLMSFIDYIMAERSEDERKRNYNYLSLILGLGRDLEFQKILNSMNVDDIRIDILSELSAFLTGVAQKYRIAIFIDDIQWADKNSVQLLKEIMLHKKVSNIIFIMSSHYEIDEFKQGADDRFKSIPLKPLDSKDVALLTCTVLECVKPDDRLLDAIMNITRGNLLYIKELLSNIRRQERYFIREGIACMDEEDILSMPGSVRELILSNLSSLSDEARLFLQAASVIGKEFSLSLAGSLVDVAADEVEVLRIPVSMNIVSFKTVHSVDGAIDKIYTFNQDLVREVIYDGILNRKKRMLHKRVGELIENRYAKEIESYYEVLCEHFSKAGQNAKVKEYCYKTALKNKNDFNLKASLEYFEKFLKLAASDAKPGDSMKVVTALKEMGHICFLTSDYEKALEYFKQALQNASLTDDIHTINIMLAGVYKEQGRFDEAMEILERIEPDARRNGKIYGQLLQMKCNILRILGNPEALSLAKKSEKILLKYGDYDSLSETMNQAGILYFIKGDIDNSLIYLNKAFRYAEKVNNLSVMVRASGNLGIIYLDIGMISRAFELFEISMDLSKKISNRQGYISGCINLGILYMGKGKFVKAEALFRDALDTSKEISSKLYECISLTNLGDVYYEKGLGEKALEFYFEALEIAKATNLSVEEGVNYIGIAKYYMKTGALEKVPDILERAYNIFTSAGEVAYVSDLYRCRSVYELLQNHLNSAFEWCEKALAASIECRSGTKKLAAVKLQGSLMMRSGKYDKALELFEEAAKIAERLKSDYESAKAFYGKYLVYRELGDIKKAEKELASARERISRVDKCMWTFTIQDCIEDVFDI